MSFQLLARGDASFANVLPDADGFRRSIVLGRRYRLERRTGRRGQPVYDLLERE